ncbi:hypothetical protein C8J56DRAFT_897909 [Mycena floridula]|nr:hypothetical protein C8J56DRAFT_897909 [Mycena floridula]
MNPKSIDKLQDAIATLPAPAKKPEDPHEYDDLDDYSGIDLSMVTGMHSPAYDADQSHVELGVDDGSFEAPAPSQNPALPPQDIRQPLKTPVRDISGHGLRGKPQMRRDLGEDGEEATSFLELRAENGRESGMLVAPLETDRRRRRSVSQTPTGDKTNAKFNARFASQDPFVAEPFIIPPAASHLALVQQLSSLDQTTVARMLQLLTSQRSLPSGSASDKAPSQPCDKTSIEAPSIGPSTDIVEKAGKAHAPTPVPVSRDIVEKAGEIPVPSLPAPAAKALPVFRISSSDVDKDKKEAPAPAAKVLPVDKDTKEAPASAPKACSVPHVPSSEVDRDWKEVPASAPKPPPIPHIPSSDIHRNLPGSSALASFLVSCGFIPGGPPPRIPSETRPFSSAESTAVPTLLTPDSSGFPRGPRILKHLRESLGSGKALPISQNASASCTVSSQSVSSPPDATTGSSRLKTALAYLTTCDDVQMDLADDQPDAISTPKATGEGFDKEHSSPSSSNNLFTLKSEFPASFPSLSSNVGPSAKALELQKPIISSASQPEPSLEEVSGQGFDENGFKDYRFEDYAQNFDQDQQSPSSSENLFPPKSKSSASCPSPSSNVGPNAEALDLQKPIPSSPDQFEASVDDGSPSPAGWDDIVQAIL